MKPILAPVPQQIALHTGTRTLPRDRTIVLFEDAVAHGTLAAHTLQAALERYAGVRWEVRAASGLAELEGVVAVIDAKAVKQREGYHLTIGEERIAIVARDGAGLYYAFATLTNC